MPGVYPLGSASTPAPQDLANILDQLVEADVNGRSVPTDEIGRVDATETKGWFNFLDHDRNEDATLPRRLGLLDNPFGVNGCLRPQREYAIRGSEPLSDHLVEAAACRDMPVPPDGPAVHRQC